MPEGLIGLPNRPFRFGKKVNLSVLCLPREIPKDSAAYLTGASWA